jgi:hypothetical protein
VLCDVINLNSFSQMLAIRLNKNLAKIVVQSEGSRPWGSDRHQAAGEDDCIVHAAQPYMLGFARYSAGSSICDGPLRTAATNLRENRST